MKTYIGDNLLNNANNLLAWSGFELARKGREFHDYIPHKQALLDAKNSGLSLDDYIDSKFNIPGATQLTLHNMEGMGVFENRIQRICEIGPGPGRYLEEVINWCHPEYYEIYEPSQDWRNWLVQKYKVVAQPVNGDSLSATPSKSIDLLQSHKFLFGNPILTIFRYLLEMTRVLNDNGVIVFDLLTTDCMNNEQVDKWVSSGEMYAASLMPKPLVLDLMAAQGLDYLGGFVVPMAPGVTEYFVFRK